MAILLLILGWLLILSAICVVVYPFLDSVVTFDPLINGLPAGILVALGAQLLSQYKNMGIPGTVYLILWIKYAIPELC